jgi:hypothetical protein
MTEPNLSSDAMIRHLKWCKEERDSEQKWLKLLESGSVEFRTNGMKPSTAEQKDKSRRIIESLTHLINQYEKALCPEAL